MKLYCVRLSEDEGKTWYEAIGEGFESEAYAEEIKANLEKERPEMMFKVEAEDID